MFKDIQVALETLEARRNMTLGIDWLRKALAHLGNPHHKLQTIHIAGTNGKGSTSNFVRGILQTAGYKVGSFTSPHLIHHNDRIRINDEDISDERLLKYINQTYDLWEAYHLSMFEIDMLISVLYFIDEKVDYVVYEVGLGGRLDATNVITPLVCGITNVDFDHMNILGDTLPEIAFEKAGIIKPNIPVFTTETKQEVLDVFENISKERHAPFKKVISYETILNDKSFTLLYKEPIEMRNQGIYQKDNASLAISIIESLSLDIDAKVIKAGIEKTHWKGRFEEVVPDVYVDGAHNMQGMTRLIESLDMLPKPWIVVFSALGDKAHHEMLEKLVKKVDQLIVTEFEFYRAEKAEVLAEGLNVSIIKNYKEAIDQGFKDKEKGTLIVTGSLYFISDARAYILEAF